MIDPVRQGTYLVVDLVDQVHTVVDLVGQDTHTGRHCKARYTLGGGLVGQVHTVVDSVGHGTYTGRPSKVDTHTQ